MEETLVITCLKWGLKPKRRVCSKTVATSWPIYYYIVVANLDARFLQIMPHRGDTSPMSWSSKIHNFEKFVPENLDVTQKCLLLSYLPPLFIYYFYRKTVILLEKLEIT